MCGIIGVAHARAGVELAPFQRSLLKLTHRGPDHNEVWTSRCGRYALGHTRLSVLDLSAVANQPMHSECGRFVIVFNGEIYNYQSLKVVLQQLGHRFRGSGDTEIVLAAYMQWGADFVQKLNGMFALAIFDGSAPDNPTLFFARDRAGEKPFYYRLDTDGLQFASELKALSFGGGIELRALNQYLSLGYVPGDACLFEGIAKLPPAHCGRYDPSSRELSVWRYWTLPPNDSDPAAAGEELADEAGVLIEDSVRLRLLADVPVGVLLSGGLDSSLVAAAAARVSSTPIETFTISLPGSSMDEARHAQTVASYFGTRHHVLPVDKPSIALLDGLAPLIDEPIADSSLLPAWLVFGLARKRVTVALGGDGGDELFGGYTDYTTSIADADLLEKVPARMVNMLARAASHLPAGVRGRNRVASLRGGPYQQLIWGRPYFDSVLRTRLLSRDAIARLGGNLEEPERYLLRLYDTGADPVDKMTRTHFGSILPDDFLFKVDRASMAHSLEVRCPFLDHRLIEFCFGRVPSHWKVKKQESRRLQRILARKWLPRDLDINRKQGFSIPINEWLRSEGEKGLMERLEDLPPEIRRDEVQSLVRGHLAGRANGGRLFALAMLSLSIRNSRR